MGMLRLETLRRISIRRSIGDSATLQGIWDFLITRGRRIQEIHQECTGISGVPVRMLHVQLCKTNTV